MSSEHKEYKPQTILVKALPTFHQRRLLTLPPITPKQFRDLQSGKSVRIEKRNFDPKIFEEVKNGDS